MLVLLLPLLLQGATHNNRHACQLLLWRGIQQLRELLVWQRPLLVACMLLLVACVLLLERHQLLVLGLLLLLLVHSY
jgi:hypothetical protein